jgi:hypothetical protein
MSTLREWLHKTKEESSSDTPNLSANFGRIIAPGFEPLNLEGFIRVEPKGKVDRAGNSPEVISITQWLDSAPNTISDLPTLISASLTLITNRRIEILPEIANSIEGTDRFLFLPYNSIPDKTLISPLKSMVDNKELKEVFRQIASLSDEDDRVITQALSLHYAACVLFDKDLAAAYALVVTGLEALSSTYGDIKIDWSDWDMAETWDKFFIKQGLSSDQTVALRAKLIKDKKMRLGDTFARYVCNELPATFWSNANMTYTYSADAMSGTWLSGEWSAAPKYSDLISTDRNLVYKSLKKSYAARSKYVHEGKREITPQSQITGLTSMLDENSPVPFALLRGMLSMILKQELKDRSDPSYELSDIQILHTDKGPTLNR